MVYIYSIFILISTFVIVFVLFFLEKIKSFGRKEASFNNQLKKLEKDYLKMRREKDKVLAVIDDFQEGILILDKDNKIEYVNFQAEKILDIQYKNILNKTILELKTFPNLYSIISLALQDLKYSFKKEVQVNENLILEIFINQLVVKKNYIGKAIIFHNITKEKIVGKTKTDFVSLTAHQLSAPLSTIKLSLEMLLDGSLGSLNEEQKDIIEKTCQRNNTLIYLVNDLLDIAKIGEKGYSYNWTTVDVQDLIESVISSNQIEIKNKKIKFKFEKPVIRIPKMILDKGKMSLVIENILDNAIKYTPVGGKVTIYLKSDKKEVEFKIQDSGIGIPENQKEKLFAKFFRSSNAIEMKSIGSGLGLFIAKSIIEDHNGKIWFESVENKGSTFFFTIPIKEVDSSS